MIFPYLSTLSFFVFCFCIAVQMASAQTATITISASAGIPISPYLYGINYVWDKVPASEFQQFETLLAQVTHYSIARYPGGWNAERLDWQSNTEYKNAPAENGVDAQTFLNAVPSATFITPSQQAIAHPGNAALTIDQSVQLVRQYGERVAVWEIGNEWWLQSGAKKHPNKLQKNLRNYAALLSAVVPAMKAANPSIHIYAMADWTKPGEISTLRQLTSPAAWSQIDGISVHTYCGILDPTRLCSHLPQMINAVRAVSGKQDIYDSEWAATQQQNPDDFGVRNATYTLYALQDLAFAGVKIAAYWPPVKNVPNMVMIASDYSAGYATGYAFGWMSEYYEGVALQLTGDIPAIAARNGSNVTVIIPAGSSPSRLVDLKLANTGLHQVVSAQVMFAVSPLDPNGDDARLVSIVTLPTKLVTGPDGRPEVEFKINPGTPGRGSGYEIARITLN